MCATSDTDNRRTLTTAEGVQLFGAYQDNDHLYMLMEWVPGGELFYYIDMHQSFDERTACFFTANVVLMMEYLHSHGVIYRDLKPENLMVDTNGYLKLADFGFAKRVGTTRTFTICGTPDYQAPEIIMRRGATKAVDYWAIGVLIFEMLVGDPPFMSATSDPWDTFRRAMTGRCHVPGHVSEAATDLIHKLLQVRCHPLLPHAHTHTCRASTPLPCNHTCPAASCAATCC